MRSTLSKPPPTGPPVAVRVALGASPRRASATSAAAAPPRPTAHASSSSSAPHAIPFCMLANASGTDEEAFTVAPEALAFLSTIRVPVIPVAVVGPYRSGKSFLLNKLLEGAVAAARAQGDEAAAAALPEPGVGFAVGPTVEACTRGIWVWSAPVHVKLDDGTDAALLLLDTEGIGGANATAEHDARVFALATLLSSLIIYNSVGAVDEDAITGLSFIANLTRHIQERAGGSGGNDGNGNEGVAGGSSGSSSGGSRLAAVEALLIRENRYQAAAEAAGAHTGAHTGLDEGNDDGSGEEGSGSEQHADSDADSDEDDDDDGVTGSNSSSYVAELRRKERRRRAAAKAAQAARVREELRRAIGHSNSGHLADVSGSAAASAAVSRRPSRLGVSAAASSSSAATAASPLTSDTLEPSSFHPSFLWVLRDFSLALVDADDGYTPITPRDYVEQCLLPRDGISAEAVARNRTRRVFTAFFKERDAFTLVRPIEDEAGLQSLERLPESSLRPEFLSQLRALQAKLFGPGSPLLRPKSIQGELLTGRMLGGLAQAYVGALNRRAVPSIGNAWMDVSRTECLEARDAAVACFEAQLAAGLAATPLPLAADALAALHASARAAALEAYDGRAVGPRAPAHRKEVARRADADWPGLQARNQAASEAACWRAARQLWGERLEPRLASAAAPSSSSAPGGTAAAAAAPYASAAELASDLAAFKAAYDAAAVGPAAAPVFGAFLVETLPSFFHAVASAHAALAAARVAGLQEEVAAARGAVAAAEVRAATFEKAYNDLTASQRAATVESARATQAAKIASDRCAAAEARAETLRGEADELRAALAVERAAHAQTKLANLGGGGGGGGGSKAGSSSGAARGPVPSDAVASFMRRANASSTGTGAARSSLPPGGVLLPLRPVGGEAYAGVGEGEYPAPPPSGCCTLM